MSFMHYVRAFRGIVWRELLRFLQQRERFFAALVRPLIWLIIFAAGFRAGGIAPAEALFRVAANAGGAAGPEPVGEGQRIAPESNAALEP